MKILLGIFFPESFSDFFLGPKKYIFFEVEKKIGYSFDAENWELSIYEVFRAIWALWEALEQKGFFPLNLKWNLVYSDSPNDIVWDALPTLWVDKRVLKSGLVQYVARRSSIKSAPISFLSWFD